MNDPAQGGRLRPEIDRAEPLTLVEAPTRARLRAVPSGRPPEAGARDRVPGGAAAPEAPGTGAQGQAGDVGELTQDGAAVAFTAAHADRFRYDWTAGGWRDWTGTHWAQDLSGAVPEAMRQTVRALASRATPSLRKGVLSAGFFAGAEKIAQSDPAHAVTAAAWDRDPWLLGTPGGTVDLRLGKLCHADPADGITRQTAAAPAETEACPQWLQFLEDATGADDNLIRFLRAWCGYCLTGETREHALIFLYGPGGNGKGLFLNTVAYVLGNYAQAASMQVFQRGSADRHPTELASLAGARMVTASETDEGKPWDEARLKNLTGSDPIRARFMFRDEFEFMPQFKLGIMGNRAPAIRNVDPAIRRRLSVIPFTRTPPAPDPDLPAKLRAEAAGILRWAINGCLDWQEYGLAAIRPAAVAAATEDYFESQDTLGNWIAQEVEVNAKASATVAELFTSWAAFARSQGEEPGTAKWLGENLARRGFQRRKVWVGGKSLNSWVGLRPRGGLADVGL